MPDMATTTSPSRTALDDLARAYWEGRLRDHPIEATVYGDRRFDHLLDDPRPRRAATGHASAPEATFGRSIPNS
jgi:hypothetical protein